jgi:hypothetical protein
VLVGFKFVRAELDILFTNVVAVNDAIKFVSQKSKEKLKSSFSNRSDEDDKDSKEPDYNEHKQGEEDGTGEMTILTTNDVFKT